jgi:hypothetical protein
MSGLSLVYVVFLIYVRRVVWIAGRKSVKTDFKIFRQNRLLVQGG